MKTYFSSICILLLTIVLITSCASPQKILNNGNYEKAYKLALKELKKGKSMTKNRSVVSESLEQIMNEVMSESNALKNSYELADVELAIKKYDGLLAKIEESKVYLRDKFEMEGELLKSEQTELVNMVGKEYFAVGSELYDEAIGKGDKLLGQDAYLNLAKAYEYNHDHPDLESLLEESLEFARVIYLIEARAPFDITYNWEIDRVFDDLEDINDIFKVFIYEDNVQSGKVDCEIDIRFDNIDFGIQERNDERTYKEEIVTGIEEITNSDGTITKKDITEIVEAYVLTKEIRKIAEWRLRLDVRSFGNNCTISDRGFQESIVAAIQDVQVSGDERALPNGIRVGQDGRLPSDDEMAEELLEILYEQVEDYLERR